MSVESDQRVDQVIGRLLQGGVLLAGTVVLAGAIVLLAQEAGATADFRVFRAEPASLRSLTGVLRDALTFDGRAIVQLGLVLLIATPIARVAFTLGAFILRRDRIYTALTAIVLGLLVYGLVS